MILIKYIHQFDFEYDIQGIVRSFYPGEETVTDKEIDARLTIEADFTDDIKKITFYENTVLNSLQIEEDIFFENGSISDIGIKSSDRKEIKNALKRAIYRILSKYTGRELLWGTLSGIRPTKITSSLLQSGMSEEATKEYMKKHYYVSDIKSDESVNISSHELSILKDIDYANGYSMYIGIPFCPSTCLYCSFTSNPIGKYSKMIDKYLDALCLEMEYCAESFKNRKINTIYIGGGTPTTLEPEQLERLLSKIEELYDVSTLHEFTVEAGRPDSITRDKLKVIKKHNVTRISINPQTMKDETLKLIGRHHTVKQFLDAYELARSEGFDNINMDFILGLPGETIDDVRYSMDEVIRLKPDSLTIHSLAIKRAARLNIFKDAYKDYEIHNSEDIMDITKNAAQMLNLEPYYLYRQKNMAGNLENIGYAREGKAGIYNILIMEEKQTILAVGAGSSTKMVFPGEERIERIENVKNVEIYIERIHEMINRKAEFLKNNPEFTV